MTNLIPGNQYVHKTNRDVVIFVGYGMHQEPIFQNIFSKSTYSGSIDYYVPYSPPVEHKRYLCWFKNSAGEVFCNILKSPWKEYKFGDNQTLLSETLVTYTEEK